MKKIGALAIALLLSTAVAAYADDEGRGRGRGEGHTGEPQFERPRAERGEGERIPEVRGDSQLHVRPGIARQPAPQP
ncbi:MAG: hypothetical protein FD160_931, partial [Caulobacteraceae bacterium]